MRIVGDALVRRTWLAGVWQGANVIRHDVPCVFLSCIVVSGYALLAPIPKNPLGIEERNFVVEIGRRAGVRLCRAVAWGTTDKGEPRHRHPADAVVSVVEPASTRA